MKIAILSRFGHMECAGFLLEIFKEDNVTLYLDYNSDKHNWMEYYKTLYNNFEIKYNEFNSDIIDKYDKVFKITSNDDCLFHKDMVSIVHANGLTDISEKFLSLTPYIVGENTSYTFPIFKTNTLNKTNKQNIVTLIGYFENKHADEDLDLFIDKNPDYTFNFVIWSEFGYHNLRKHCNVNVLHNVNTPELVDIINSSKYILSKRYINYTNFSGQLGLAMSFEIPLIVDNRTASSYGLPGVFFDTSYNEIEKLESISDEKYNKLVEDIKAFNEKALEKNSEIIRGFVQK